MRMRVRINLEPTKLLHARVPSLTSVDPHVRFDLLGNSRNQVAKEPVLVGIYGRKKGMNRAKPNW